MKKSFLKVLKLSLTSIFLITFLTSCSSYKDVVTGQNHFYLLVHQMVNAMNPKLVKNISPDEVVLVSDFVNLDKLKNKSKLGFLLSDSLKNSMSTQNFIVREVELRDNFELGKTGFNVLTRKQREINKKEVDSKYAMVGTYSITKESLILFIKLIDITNGNILASMHGKTTMDEEIKELEQEQRVLNVYAPMTL